MRKSNKEFDPSEYTIDDFAVDGKIPENILKGAIDLSRMFRTGEGRLKDIYTASRYASFNNLDCADFLKDKSNKAVEIINKMRDEHIASGGCLLKGVSTGVDIVAEILDFCFKNPDGHPLVRDFLEIDKYKYILSDHSKFPS